MATKKLSLRYVETEGGAFVLLPLELKKHWHGIGDEDEGVVNDYARTDSIGTGVGLLDVKGGHVLILGSPEVTAFWPLSDGGLFVQRIMGDEDAEVIAVFENALADARWKKTNLTFDAGNGKLALFDSAYAYEDADDDELLKVALAPGKYKVEMHTAKAAAVEIELVRLRKAT